MYFFIDPTVGSDPGVCKAAAGTPQGSCILTEAGKTAEEVCLEIQPDGIYNSMNDTCTDDFIDKEVDCKNLGGIDPYTYTWVIDGCMGAVTTVYDGWNTGDALRYDSDGDGNLDSHIWKLDTGSSAYPCLRPLNGIGDAPACP